MDLGITGDVAVVAGGANGIGRAIVTALAAEGCRVVVWDVDVPAAQGLTADLANTGADASTFSVDVRSSAAVAAAADQTLRQHGSVQILVNCAGFSRDAPLVEMTDGQWNDVIGLCLTGTFNVIRAFAPTMIAQRYGRIVSISSRARHGEVNKANYAAAKSGVDGLTRALALELGEHGITVNAVAPGFVETDRLRDLPTYQLIRERALARTPTPRLGEVADISDAVCYLAARQSAFITGEVIDVAGGRLR